MTLPPPASLRAAAYGLYPLQAATGPVIAHRTRLAREDSGPLHPPRHRTAAIDWEAAISTPDAGGLPSPGGEQQSFTPPDDASFPLLRTLLD
jgi:hypothetical protein